MRPQRERVAGSPRPPCPNVNLDEAKIRFRCHDSYVAVVQSTASTPPGNGFSSSSSHVERRIVFSIVVLIIGHLKQTLEVHLHGALMTNYGLQVLSLQIDGKDPVLRPGHIMTKRQDHRDWIFANVGKDLYANVRLHIGFPSDAVKTEVIAVLNQSPSTRFSSLGRSRPLVQVTN
jgi:hypothetical protein